MRLCLHTRKMSNSSPPRVALIDETNDLIYSTPETGYKLYDILWSDGKATQEVRPVSDGVVPIGLCVIPTNWLDEGEKARFVSLKYMHSYYMDLYWGASYDEKDTLAPYDDPNNDPLQQYYIPYIAKNELNNEQDIYDVYYYIDDSTSKNKIKNIKDIRIQENWLYTLDYCKENSDKYAIGDINGKQNTINISVEGNWGKDINLDMKYCVSKYAPEGTQAGEWYIPALGELLQFTFRLMKEKNVTNVNDKMAEISNIYPQNCEKDFNYSLATYWSSSVKSATEAYNCVVFSDNICTYNDERGFFGRAVVAFLQR